MKKTWIVLASGATVVTLAMGVRQAFGLFLPSVSAELAISRGSFGMALAVQNLLFGLAQPFIGALADKHGAGRVTFFGALLYAAGLLAASTAAGALGLHLSLGVAIGLALSATTFVTVLGVVGRVVSRERRTLAFGLVTAGGSLGQFLIVPIGQWLLAELGFRGALVALAGIVACIAPLALGLAGRPTAAAIEEAPQPMGEALREAAGHSGFWLLNAGFFVCGFHIAFLATHFPAYLNDKGLGLTIGATALALIGLFNIFGSYAFGAMGDRYRKKWVLSALYAGRGLVLALFVALPLSSTSALVFAAAMGFLWLGTVPLTSGLVSQIFGVRYLSTLYGIVFMTHQVGSFFGAWASGYAFDRTGNYDWAWGVSIALAVLAAAVHVPVRDAPLGRLQPA